MSAQALQDLRNKIDAPAPFHPDRIVAATLKKHHREKAEAQDLLRDTLALWGGERTAKGDSISMAQRRFFHKFGIDVGTAQTLNARSALELNQKVINAGS